MKKFSILLLLCIALVGCKDKSTDFGTVKYYPSFLWVSDSISPVVKTMDCDFSIDAQNDASSFAEFQFVDNYDKPIPTSEMQVKVDGVVAEHNIFRVYSKTDSVKLEFTFSPDAETGKHQGYLKLINHKLDRLDSQQLSVDQKVDVFQWTLDYDKSMNPLKKVLKWISITIVACLMFWFFIIRPSVYPHFGKFRKSILIKQNDIIVGQMTFAFTDARKVVFYDRKVKQSIWSRIFIGEIKTYVNPLFKTKLTFSPKRRNAAAFGTGYTVNPNPIPRSGVATINNHFEKLSITLS
ncbi:MAG: hypothetical protein MJZ41_12150 [Bacteroidaceae bacterium]|nr:hypothetical protein [Bacteroidaceae bacterium]